MREFGKSQRLFEEAKRYIPGGVNSPVRAFTAVGGTPPFIVKGRGSKIYDADNNEFIDYVCSWGPLILGHAHPMIVEALKKAVERGTSFGATTELEITLAKMVSQAMPSMEMLRFVNSGTEATMSALRLARAYTGRDKIIKFAGGYHGHADGLLVEGGSGIATLSIPGSPGVPLNYTRDTLVASYNDFNSVEQYFYKFPGEIAGVIIEPVAANMGVILPQPEFLKNLHKLTQETGALLIFDEVITGFRITYGGAQSFFGIKPDLTCLGKIIGGGLPIGAYGGRREIMEMMAPAGQVYQAGTLSGNPLAMTAGIETLKILTQPGVYDQLEKKTSTMKKEISYIAEKAGIPLYISSIASLMTIFFARNSIIDYKSAKTSDTTLFGKFLNALLDEGVYWPPSQFEAAFISLAHNEQDILFTIKAIDKALNSILS